MNKSFKVVFNKARGALMVVNEITSIVQAKGTKTVVATAVAAMIAGVAGSAIAEDVITFPSLSNWTAASSVSEGFNRQLLSVNTSGWDPIFNPITSNCDYSTNTVLLADSSANFKQNQNYFIHASNDLSINLSDSTLRLLDESNNPPGVRYELATLLKVEEGASMNFIGSESSAIQMKGQGSRAIFVEKEGSLDLKTGHVWIELKNDIKSPSNIVQVQFESSFKIDAVNDIVFIADLSKSDGIEHAILNSGKIDLLAKNIYVGIDAPVLREYGGNINRLIDLNGRATIGDDRTELIALNKGRVGLKVSNIDYFNLKSKALQIIGDGAPESKAIQIVSDAKDKMKFDGGVGYFANVETGISLTYAPYSSAKLHFHKLRNLASAKAIDMNRGDLTLSIAESAFFDKTVDAVNGSSLTLVGKDFVFNEGIKLNNSRLRTACVNGDDDVVSGSVYRIAARKIRAEARSEVDIRGSVLIDSGLTTVSSKDLNNDGHYALLNAGSIMNINHNETKDSVTQIKGDIYVVDHGQVSLGLADKRSWFIGTINPASQGDSSEAGSVAMSLKKGALWCLTSANHLPVDLTLNGGIVRLDQDNDGNNAELMPNNSKDLTVENLSGDGGIFYVRTHLQEVFGDHIHVNNGAGRHQLLIASSGEEPSQNALHRALITQKEGSLEISLANQGGHVDLGTYVYDLVSRTTENGVEWYLDDVSTTPENPDSETDPDPEPEDPKLSPTAKAVLAMAGMGGQNAMYHNQLSDLRKRLGEVRGMTESNGLWVSASGQRDRFDGFASNGVKQNAYRFNLGLDHKIGSWLVGANFKYLHGTQKTSNPDSHAKGKVNSAGANIYGTWIAENGFYTDIVASFDHYHQKITTSMLDGRGVSGKVNNFGLGLSAEVGKKFGLTKDFFVEPQAQLAYYWIKGKDFSMSNGMKVEQDDFNSLVGRLGVVAGKDFKDAEGNTKGQVFVKGGVKQQFAGKQKLRANSVQFKDELKGTSGYYGLGFEANPNKKVSLYGHVERENGKHYTKEIEVMLGLRYKF